MAVERAAAPAPPSLALASGYEQNGSATPLWDDQDADAAPMFSVGKVQYALPGALLGVAAACNRLVLCMAPSESAAPLRLLFLDLDDPTHTYEGTMGVAARAAGDVRVFVDPSATHVLVSAEGGTWYWTPSWRKATLLARWQGVPVTAVAWGPSRATPPVVLPPAASGLQWIWTPPMVLGTARGDLIEAVLVASVGEERLDLLDRWARKTSGAHAPPLERGVHRLWSLAEPQRITGLALHVDGTDATLAVATETRLYEFAGAWTDTPPARGDADAQAAHLFDAYQAGAPHLKTDLPRGAGGMATARPPTSAGRTLAWLSGAGVYAGTLTPRRGVDHTQLWPYPQRGAPRFVGHTPLHHVLVYSDALVCVHAMTGHVAHDGALPLSSAEPALGVAMDPVSDTCWVYTSRSLLEVVVDNETRDLWRVLLEQHRYDEALTFCQDDTSRRAVWRQRAESLVRERRFDEAVDCFVQARSPSMECVILQLAEADAHDALRRYIAQQLTRTPATARVPRLMLATYLLELHLAALDAASGADAAARLREAEDMLLTHYAALDAPTTYRLLARQNHAELWALYARLRHDTRKVVQRWVEAEEWDRALAALSTQSSPALYYEFAAVLMRHAPQKTVQCWERCDTLDLAQLLPALLQHAPAPHEPDYALEYLRFAIDVRRSPNRAAHAMRLTRLLARPHDRGQLLAFVENASPDSLDLAFALRACARASCQEACVRLYARMEQYEQAVRLALDARDVELACQCADLPHDDPALRRELWLQCAKYVIESTPSMQEAMQLVRRTDLLTVEDILPFFPDFTVIDDFKSEICDTLESYVTKIDALKDELDHTTAVAASLQQDLRALGERAVDIDADQVCVQCLAPLATRALYVFPCRHGYHADCLTAQVTQHLPPRRLRRLVQLQSELEAGARAKGSDAPARSPKSFIPLGSLERLREHVRPHVIVDVLTASWQAGVDTGRRAFTPLDNDAPRKEAETTSTSTKSSAPPSLRHADDSRAAPSATPSEAGDGPDQPSAYDGALRAEMQTLVAGTCPMCTLSVQLVDAPLGTDDDDDFDS